MSDSAAPDGPTELAIAAILEELTELEGVGRDDNFFELGVHSLVAVQVAVCIEERFAVLIEDDDVDAEDFASFGTLLAFVRRKTLI